MISAMREKAKSLLVKVLLVLIALSFAVWGIGDIFRGNQRLIVATVGDVEIPSAILADEYSRAVERLRRQTDGAIDAEQARAMGIVEQTLQGIVSRTAFDQAIDGMGIAVPPEVVVSEIRDMPAFHNMAGQFDRALYEMTLQSNRLGLEQFEQSVRRDIARELLIDSVATGVEPPSTLIERIRKVRDERRVVDAVIIKGSELDNPPQPDEATIQEYYDRNSARFMAPEYRRLTYFVLRPMDLMDEIDVPEDEIVQEYEYRLDEFTTIDRRNIDWMVFDDKETADAAYQRLVKGEDFIEVGTDMTTMSEDGIAFGEATRADLSDISPPFAETVFALEEGGISQPIETPLGWRVVRVNEVLAGGPRPFEDVRNQIRLDLLRDRALEVMFELSNRFEDERAGGATLEEAARAVGLTTQTVPAVDALGNGPDGAPVTGLPPAPEFLVTAFELPVGEPSRLIETDDGAMFVIRVESITAPVVRPLSEVRGQVIAAWQSDWRDRRAEEIAEAIAQDVRDGASLEEAAGEQGQTVLTSSPFKRSRQGLDITDLNAEAVTLAFEMAPDQVSDPIFVGPTKYAVIAVREVLPADEEAEGTSQAGLTRQLQAGLQADIVSAYQAAIQERLGVRIYPATVDSMFDQ